MSGMPIRNRPATDRARWPVRAVRRSDESIDADTTPEQRLAMMWELAVQAWTISGVPLPDYDRAHTPVSIRRRQDDEA